MARRHPVWAWGSLAFAALLAGLLWRVEVEWHGWAGLTWVDYFHWAVPIGVLLFLGWLALFCGVRPMWKRTAFLATAALFALVSYHLAGWALTWRFIIGPSALLLFLTLGENEFHWYKTYAIWMVAPVIPAVACLLPRLFRVRIGWVRPIVCFAVFFAAEPLAVLLLRITHHIGGPDPIHALKSGFIIPLLVFALGVPFLPQHRKRHPPLSAEGEQE